ncbi:MAG: hypothetical protein KDE27_03700 [Planctomycetes bacterium]|nr:hypothetical protein [Planctomycetota bacterium]
MSELVASKATIARRFHWWLATFCGIAIALSSWGPIVSVTGGLLTIPLLIAAPTKKKAPPARKSPSEDQATRERVTI